MISINTDRHCSNLSSTEVTIQPLSQEVLDNAKIAYTCRRINFNTSMTVIAGNISPVAGNLVLAQVDTIGQHKGVESNGRRHDLFPGDQIIVSYGNRYAPNQFEAEIPNDLSPCDLVAAGGMASKVLSKHDSMNKATTLIPIGLIGDTGGAPINLAQWALPPKRNLNAKPLVFAVLGTSMNAGKTTSAANLIRGLSKAGLKVGAAKVTGTGAPKDMALMKDAGAYKVYDFTDAGYPSTYLLSDEEIEAILLTLTSHLTDDHVDVIVLEIADGLFQRETEALCLSKQFAQTVDNILFAAGDAMGATFGAEWLIKHNLPILGLSGVFTSSALAIREAKKHLNIPIFKLAELSSPDIAWAFGLKQKIGQVA